MYLPGPMTGLGNGLLTGSLLTGSSTVGIPPPPVVPSATPGLDLRTLISPTFRAEVAPLAPTSVAEAYANANGNGNGVAPFPWGKVLFWGAVGVGTLWVGSKLLKKKPATRTNRKRRRRYR